MTIQVLIAAMYQKSLGLPQENGLAAEDGYVLINQTTFGEYPDLQLRNPEAQQCFLSTEERGTSKSRNMAIANASADICAVSDDDILYVDNYKELIANAYEQFPEADIILFDYIDRDTAKNKDSINSLQKKPGRVDLLHALRSNSCRVTFRLQSIRQAQHRFREKIGPGTPHITSCEDVLFVVDAIRKGLKVYYAGVPLFVRVAAPSSWFAGFNEQYFKNVGAFGTELLGRHFWWLHPLQFYLRHKTARKQLSLCQALRYGREGKRLFLQYCQENNQ